MIGNDMTDAGKDWRLSGSLHELIEYMDRDQATGYQRYSRMKRHLISKARNSNVPLIGTFELTPLCNLDCKMCYVHLRPSQLQGRDILGANIWCGLIDRACESGMLYAALTGGECLTHPEFDAIYRHLSTKGVEITVLTNGVLVEDAADRLFGSHPPACVQVTLYGSDEETYERVTGHRVLSRVLHGIERIRSAGIPLMVGMTPSRYIGDNAKALVSLIRELDLPYSINAGLFAARDDTGRCLTDFEIALDDYIEVLKYDAALSGRPLEPCVAGDVPMAESHGGKGGIGVGCAAGRSAFAISWDGVMRGCNVLNDFCAYPLRDGFPAAWQAVNRASQEYPKPVECAGCQYVGICKHCVAEHRKGAEKGHANPEICAWRHRMNQEGLFSGVVAE